MVLVYYKADIIRISSNVTCSCNDIAEKSLIIISLKTNLFSP
jgi:hypothetical protein